jgi:hypothetical protein
MVPRRTKCIETESRKWLPGAGGGEMGAGKLIRNFRARKISGDGRWWWLYKNVHLLNANKLYN